MSVSHVIPRGSVRASFASSVEWVPQDEVSGRTLAEGLSHCQGPALVEVFLLSQRKEGEQIPDARDPAHAKANSCPHQLDGCHLLSPTLVQGSPQAFRTCHFPPPQQGWQAGQGIWQAERGYVSSPRSLCTHPLSRHLHAGLPRTGSRGLE